MLATGFYTQELDGLGHTDYLENLFAPCPHVSQKCLYSEHLCELLACVASQTSELG